MWNHLNVNVAFSKLSNKIMSNLSNLYSIVSVIQTQVTRISVYKYQYVAVIHK